MPLKKSAGNMYPWVTHTHSHLRGKCSHGCPYCYVQAMEQRFQTGQYAGPLRLDEAELHVEYGQHRTIFVEHMNDLFCSDVPDVWICDVIAHCRRFPKNQYVFQTKAPHRVPAWLEYFPPLWMLGTTIESTEMMPKNPVPSTASRARGMVDIREQRPDARLFVTIEPIQEPLDVGVMKDWLTWIRPTFVNVGADSKGHGLHEPSAEKVEALLAVIKKLKIEIRKKSNLARLLSK